MITESAAAAESDCDDSLMTEDLPDDDIESIREKEEDVFVTPAKEPSFFHSATSLAEQKPAEK